MSKVICDVCGTAYPETAAQCPICNSAKKPSEPVSDGHGAESTSGYVYVKGGRFSKKNVRRRNKGGSNPRRSARRKSEPSNAGLVIIAILLLAAIVAVVIYIATHYFPSGSTGANDDTTPQTTDSQTEEQTSQQVQIPCTLLQLSSSVVELQAEGDTWTLVVAVEPMDTTDAVRFESSDESVAVVSSNGVITAVDGGEAIITVTCGDVSANCAVTCSFGEPETTDPEETVVSGEFDFEWATIYVDSTTGYGDATVSKGSSWKAYKSSLEIDPTLIAWSSDDSSVCTIEDGIVTAVGKGKTLVHATYNGVTYTCIIRVS